MQIQIKDDFDLEKISVSGQCFRVRQFEDGTFRFITGEHVIYIRLIAFSRKKTSWSDFTERSRTTGVKSIFRALDNWERRKLGDEATGIIAGGDIDRDLILEKGRVSFHSITHLYPCLFDLLKSSLLNIHYGNIFFNIKSCGV